MPTAAKICERLLARYPKPKIALHFRNPLELLVATILSAQCTDERVNAVTPSLFAKYLTAADYANAPPGELESDIRPTGFYKNKAKALKSCCRMLVERHNGEVPESLEALVKLPGVGRKTANIVRACAFGQPAIAVDTHVRRVANRLGLSGNRDPDKIEQDLMQQLPQEAWTPFFLAMILHGRETCTARNPHCAACILASVCPWPDKPRQ